jgi:tellurite resistance-related uncharacterized protein
LGCWIYGWSGHQGIARAAPSLSWAKFPSPWDRDLRERFHATTLDGFGFKLVVHSWKVQNKQTNKQTATTGSATCTFPWFEHLLIMMGSIEFLKFNNKPSLGWFPKQASSMERSFVVFPKQFWHIFQIFH